MTGTSIVPFNTFYERAQLNLTWFSPKVACSSKESYLEGIKEALIKATLEQKKIAFGVEFLLFEEEERTKAIEIVEILL